jgi:hypothetical protein
MPDTLVKMRVSNHGRQDVGAVRPTHSEELNVVCLPLIRRREGVRAAQDGRLGRVVFEAGFVGEMSGGGGVDGRMLFFDVGDDARVNGVSGPDESEEVSEDLVCRDGVVCEERGFADGVGRG